MKCSAVCSENVGKARSAFRLGRETGRELASWAGGCEGSVVPRSSLCDQTVRIRYGDKLYVRISVWEVRRTPVLHGPCGLKPVGTESFEVVWVGSQSSEFTWEQCVGERKRADDERVGEHGHGSKRKRKDGHVLRAPLGKRRRC